MLSVAYLIKNGLSHINIFFGRIKVLIRGDGDIFCRLEVVGLLLTTVASITARRPLYKLEKIMLAG